MKQYVYSNAYLVLHFNVFIKTFTILRCSLFWFMLVDDPGAVHPGIPAKPPPEAGLCYGVPCRDLRLAEALSLFLHPSSPRHHDRQPSLDHLDPKGHELHGGKH